MAFVGKVWKVLVGIKDGLVLLFMLLFFIALFSILSASPNPGQVREGALQIDLSGFVVEESSAIDPVAALLNGATPPAEFEARDIVRALDSAASDDRIKAVVIDMSAFLGGGQVHLQAIGEAMDRVRASEKPVLTYALAYGDDHIHLAAHASEVWADPLGGAIVAGPGGSILFYRDLIDKLNVNARIYRVGEFKSAVEPYERTGLSDAARENLEGLYGSLWEEWQANVKKARPAADLDRVTSDPVAWIESASGDLAKAAVEAGLVDKLGDSIEFGDRVAEIVGKDSWDEAPGAYAKSDLTPFLADTAPSTSGKRIGVVTVAGTIVDGDAGPGTAGGTRIATILNDALDDDLAGLVVRVNSPGGSVTASEEIRRAILRYKAKDIPVAISFANVAASGGYWVATAGDRIFAQPETITGSIGVFAVLPTFENATGQVGITTDGFRTTPLSGQPDIIGGLTPETDAFFQATIIDTYSDFLNRVAKARGISKERADEIGQGRVWDGGTARQLGLVDQFGGMQDALEWVAGQAELEEGDWSALYLGSPTDSYDTLIRQLLVDGGNTANTPRQTDLFARAALNQSQVLARITTDADRLSGAHGIQAYCLECPVDAHAPSGASQGKGLIAIWQMLLAK